jgi:hypothetical protein
VGDRDRPVLDGADLGTVGQRVDHLVEVPAPVGQRQGPARRAARRDQLVEQRADLGMFLSHSLSNRPMSH